MVVADIKRKTLQDHIEFHVEPGSEVHTDQLKSYQGLPAEYVHNVVNHAERYVEGHVYTNGVENFWSLLKRTIKGTYTSCEAFHLFRYLDEQCFRFNNRKIDDVERFEKAMGGVEGKRLTYRQLIGEEKWENGKPRRGGTKRRKQTWILDSSMGFAMIRKIVEGLEGTPNTCDIDLYVQDCPNRIQLRWRCVGKYMGWWYGGRMVNLNKQL
jgi:hypothetical protein